jgi:hypothetical protein
VQTLEHGWNLPCNQVDKAKKLGAKFKTLRKSLDNGTLKSLT